LRKKIKYIKLPLTKQTIFPNNIEDIQKTDISIVENNRSIPLRIFFTRTHVTVTFVQKVRRDTNFKINKNKKHYSKGAFCYLLLNTAKTTSIMLTIDYKLAYTKPYIYIYVEHPEE
jgi:hypothetical protein